MRVNRPQIDNARVNNLLLPLAFPRRFVWPPLPPVAGEGGQSGGGGASGSWEGGTCGTIQWPVSKMLAAVKDYVGALYRWTPAEQPDGGLSLWAYRWMPFWAEIDGGTWGFNADPNITRRVGEVGDQYESMISLCEGTIYEGKKYSAWIRSRVKAFPPNFRYFSWLSAYKITCEDFWLSPWSSGWGTWTEFVEESRNSSVGGYTQCIFHCPAELYADFFIYPRYYFKRRVGFPLSVVPLLPGITNVTTEASALIFGLGVQTQQSRKRKRRIV
jgi:hypothetical protein